MWCEIVTDFGRLEDLSPAWQQLTGCGRQAEIFQQWEWVRAFWKAYGTTLSLCCPVVHRGESVIGIWPLVLRGETIQFLGSPESDYNDILCEERHADVVLRVALSALLRLPVNWQCCSLDNVSSDSLLLRQMLTLPSHLRKYLQVVFASPAPTLLLKEDKQDVLNRLIEQLKRRQKTLQKLGCVTFRHLETREEAREHLDRLFHQHITRWALIGSQSLFMQPVRRNFYSALIEELDLQTQLRFGVLELNKRPIAYHFGFQSSGKFTFYKPTFDINFWDHSPGDVLLNSLFQYVRQAAVSEFDFSVGGEAYKYRFANQVKENYALYLYRDPTGVKSCFYQLVRHGLHRVRQRPAVADRLRGAVHSLRSALSRANYHARSKGFLSHSLNRLWRAFRDSIWTDAELLFFSANAQAADGATGFGIVPGTLDGLASLSLEYPHFLNEVKLREYRGRLKRGDRVFLGRGVVGEASIIWLGRRGEIPVPEIRGSLPLERPATVIYDAWAGPAPADGLSANVLRDLAGHCAGEELWIYCLGRQTALRRAIEDAGFHLMTRMSHRAFLQRFRRTSILAVSPAVGSSSATERNVSCPSMELRG